VATIAVAAAEATTETGIINYSINISLFKSFFTRRIFLFH